MPVWPMKLYAYVKHMLPSKIILLSLFKNNNKKHKPVAYQQLLVWKHENKK